MHRLPCDRRERGIGLRCWTANSSKRRSCDTHPRYFPVSITQSLPQRRSLSVLQQRQHEPHLFMQCVVPKRFGRFQPLLQECDSRWASPQHEHTSVL